MRLHELFDNVPRVASSALLHRHYGYGLVVVLLVQDRQLMGELVLVYLT